MRPGTRIPSAIALLVALAGCPAEEAPRCDAAEPCPPGRTCEATPEGLLCLCTTDEACPDDAFCNAAGRCQARSACRTNADCGAGTFCEAALGACVPDSTCGRDVHCAPGFVCADAEAGCVPGCREDGDCPLYQVCEGAEGETLGACNVGCRDTSACPFGHRCVGGRCFASPNPSHCAVCDEDRACPDATDWCLINARYTPARPELGTAFQCAVDCDGRPEICPNGYLCAPVVRLTAAPCEIDEQCAGVRRCVTAEGADRGFCSCRLDADCSYAQVPPTCTLAGCLFPPGRLCGEAADCDPVARCDEHNGTGRGKVCYRNRSLSCESYRDCLCVGGTCVRDGRACTSWEDCEPVCESGRCRVGAACSPAEGLSCPDLRP